jgi:prepilin-type N-terminal cleavage/methylation domain-containing protein
VVDGILPDPGRSMTNQRGFSIVELLVAATLVTIVAGALFSAYVATARSFGESSAQAALQRQGTLVLEEISRQARGAIKPKPGERLAFSVDTCNGNLDSLWVRTAAGDICYYPRNDGALCEARGTTCRNLLAGGLKTIALLRQPAAPDPRCPLGPDLRPRPAGAWCFTIAAVDAPKARIDLSFAIRDDDGDLDGRNVMAFSISLTCSGRNCS